MIFRDSVYPRFSWFFLSHYIEIVCLKRLVFTYLQNMKKHEETQACIKLVKVLLSTQFQLPFILVIAFKQSRLRKNLRSFLWKIVLIQANIRNMFFYNRSPTHLEFGVGGGGSKSACLNNLDIKTIPFFWKIVSIHANNIRNKFFEQRSPQHPEGVVWEEGRV